MYMYMCIYIYIYVYRATRSTAGSRRTAWWATGVQRHINGAVSKNIRYNTFLEG